MVYNPYAGTGKIKEWLSNIVETFTKAGYDILIRPTLESVDTSLMVKEYLEKEYFDKIVCSGGDGTLNQVISGIIMSGIEIDLGYIPAGTTNDFAYNLGVSKNPSQAVSVILKGEPFKCDLGSINGRYFTYVAAFGLFTDVSYETLQISKNLLGRLAYILQGIKKISSSLKSYELELICGNKTISGEFMYGMITNSESVGGFKGITGKDVLLDDGCFECIFIKAPKHIIELQEIINSLVTGDLKSDLIISVPIEKLQVKSKNLLPWTIDGEYGGEYHEAEIEVKKHAFSIMRKIRKF